MSRHDANGDPRGPGRAGAYSARPHPEHVVLEIGEDLGALIVHAEPEMHGAEIEISPAGDDDSRTHKEVLERTLDGRPAQIAVFDKLTQGEYTLWTGGVARARLVRITGGEIAEIDWTAAADDAAARAR